MSIDINNFLFFGYNQLKFCGYQSKSVNKLKSCHYQFKSFVNLGLIKRKRGRKSERNKNLGNGDEKLKENKNIGLYIIN